MEKFEKINKMEKILDSHQELIDKLNTILDEFEASQESYQELREYYASEEYMEDVEKSNNGEIPEEIKCGVLSEDAVFDLIGDNFYAGIRLLELGTKVMKEH